VDTLIESGLLPVSPALGLSAGLGGGPGGGDGESLLDLLTSEGTLRSGNEVPNFRAAIGQSRPIEVWFLENRGSSLALAI
jgi:hypothetical protein